MCVCVYLYTQTIPLKKVGLSFREGCSAGNIDNCYLSGDAEKEVITPSNLTDIWWYRRSFRGTMLSPVGYNQGSYANL